jgi:hypothetical protein
VLGLVLASVAWRVLTTVDPTGLPPLAPVRLDLTVIAFTLLLSHRNDPALRRRISPIPRLVYAVG